MCGSESRKDKVEIGQITFDQSEVLPCTQKNFSNLKIIIPCVCPSLQNMCPFIQSNYMFEIILNIENKSAPVELKNISIPIEIGTIPIYSINESSSSTSPENSSAIPKVIYMKKDSKEANNDGEIIYKKDIISGFSPTYPFYINLP